MGRYKETYRGHEIEVSRERCMGGERMLYYSVFRVSDGYECTSGFSSGNDKKRAFAKHLRDRIDSELASESPWGGWVSVL